MRKRLKNTFLILTFACALFITIKNNQGKKIKIEKKNNLSLILNPVFENEIKEFDSISNKYCNVSDLKVNQSLCLVKLKELDLKHNNLLTNKLNFNCDECLRQRNNSEIYTIYYHTFWQIETINTLKLNFYIRVLNLNLMSYLSTQNLCCTKFFIWKLEQFPNWIEQDLRKTYYVYFQNKNIEIKNFDLNELCSNKYKSSFSKHQICLNNSNENLSAKSLISLSDFVRFFVLDIYGGIYVDGDVLFLKDMKYLWNKNFLYRWSYTENFNTAVLGINHILKPIISILYNHFKSLDYKISEFISILHPYRLSELIKDIDKSNNKKHTQLTIFHSFLFDPAWLCFDGIVPRLNIQSVCDFKDFNDQLLIQSTEFRPDNFFNGAFTYHIHLGNCGFNIRNNSYFKHFENHFKNLLKI